jgi:FKBP12-rapamycin complex-associated protein
MRTNAGEFMLARYREVVEIVLHFRESKEKLVRQAVITLIPRLAAFAPERFAATYLSTCTDYLIDIVKCAGAITPRKLYPGKCTLGTKCMSPCISKGRWSLYQELCVDQTQ